MKRSLKQQTIKAIAGNEDGMAAKYALFRTGAITVEVLIMRCSHSQMVEGYEVCLLILAPRMGGQLSTIMSFSPLVLVR